MQRPKWFPKNRVSDFHYSLTLLFLCVLSMPFLCIVSIFIFFFQSSLFWLWKLMFSFALFVDIHCLCRHLKDSVSSCCCLCSSSCCSYFQDSYHCCNSSSVLIILLISHFIAVLCRNCVSLCYSAIMWLCLVFAMPNVVAAFVHLLFGDELRQVILEVHAHLYRIICAPHSSGWGFKECLRRCQVA